VYDAEPQPPRPVEDPAGLLAPYNLVDAQDVRPPDDLDEGGAVWTT
jgi:hypothetical protein